MSFNAKDPSSDSVAVNDDNNNIESPTARSEQQQAELLTRLNTLIDALSRMDSRVETTSDPDAILHTLSQELRRLKLECFVAMLEPDTESLVVRYFSSESKVLALIEKTVGGSVFGFRIPRERFTVYEEVVEHQCPLLVVDWRSVVAPMLPSVPASILEQAGQLAGLTLDTRVAYLPMHVADRVRGVMGIWGEDLWESDLPALSLFACQVAMTIDGALLFEELRAMRERLRQLVRRIVTAQEDERQRVSRELHDEAGQALTALKIGLELIQTDMPRELASFRLRLGDAAALVDQTLEQIHLLAQDLRPPALDAIGLSATLDGFCKDFGQRTQLSIRYQSTELPTLPGVVSISFYRFLQEALTNVARHAQANRVRVALCHEADKVSLSIEDDGRGFDVHNKITTSSLRPGLGLVGVRERFELLGGRLEIESHAQQGTRLVACVPVNGVE